MWTRVALLCALLLPLLAPAQERRRPAELTVVEIDVRRNVDIIQIDGRLKNIGQRRAEDITLIVHFLAPGRAPLETREGPLDEETLAPGAESEFSFETPFQPRLVEIRLEAKDKSGRPIRLNRPGPYRID